MTEHQREAGADVPEDVLRGVKADPQAVGHEARGPEHDGAYLEQVTCVLGAREDPGRRGRNFRSILQKSVYRNRDAHRMSHSFLQKVGAVRVSQEPSQAEFRCMRVDACAAVQERRRDGTREVLPRTTTTLVVLKAPADHTPVESRRREDFQRKTVLNRRFTRSAQSRFTKRAGRVLTRIASRRRLERSMQHSADEPSEGCRDSIRQAWSTRHEPQRGQSERSLESYPSVGCSNHETEGGSPHTRL